MGRKVLLVGAVLVAGLSLLFAFSVRKVAPRVNEITRSLKNIEAKLSQAPSTDMPAVMKRLEALEREVKQLKARPVLPSMPQEPEEDLTKVYDIPVDGSAILGKKDAPVTITVFVDYQCPFCARFHPAVMEAVKANPDKVKFMLKHYPLSFHPNARPAAKAAFAAGVQGKFYEMTDLLLQNAGDLTEVKFKEHAGKLGLNVDQFMKDYKDRDAEWEKKIKADMELAEKSGVRGTPSYYLNGRATMARSSEQWKQEIEAALKAPQAK